MEEIIVLMKFYQQCDLQNLKKNKTKKVSKKQMLKLIIHIPKNTLLIEF